ncbi:hypothetical protein MAPG_06177 [Magnaporthiopsis poae ATCC 64411]|uniref:Uncharacterized protein n=1 Tax=Magnaporthiopsis poae (strain ATCC 64411 / 73-15) TaxID=644358 RepID=A0A0C4E1B9_MAGP6|nr:hypothetical protein MAPG_06177 [Magnaporthiopsis poae ATCC 64411]
MLGWMTSSELEQTKLELIDPRTQHTSQPLGLGHSPGRQQDRRQAVKPNHAIPILHSCRSLAELVLNDTFTESVHANGPCDAGTCDDRLP